MQISKDDIDILKLYEDSGVDESYGSEPYNFFSDSSSVFVKKNSGVGASGKMDLNMSILKAKQKAEEFVSGVYSLADLQKVVSEFSFSPLSKFANHSIFGVGVENPNLLVITEMPDADEDRSGIPMSGDTGELLRKILGAMNSSVETNVYTFPVSSFRTPGARVPTFEEVQIALPFVKKFIELLKPKLILTMGSVPMYVLFGKTDPITALRGQWFEYEGIPVMSTFALTYLLNNVEAKKKTWADLKLLMQKF